MLTFSKMFHGDFKRQIMKQPWTKKQKFCFWTKRPAKNKNKNNTNETPSLDLALRAGKKRLDTDHTWPHFHHTVHIGAGYQVASSFGEPEKNTGLRGKLRSFFKTSVFWDPATHLRLTSGPKAVLKAGPNWPYWTLVTGVGEGVRGRGVRMGSQDGELLFDFHTSCFGLDLTFGPVITLQFASFWCGLQ